MSDGLIEIEVNTPSKKAPAVAKRLAESPKTLFPTTPEKSQQRQDKAASARKVLL